MGKTRSCRRTEDENKIHDKAVKMRKMTDEQLVHYVEDRVEKARSEGSIRERKQLRQSTQTRFWRKSERLKESELSSCRKSRVF